MLQRILPCNINAVHMFAFVRHIIWRGSGCRLFGAKGKRYKLFWMESKERLNSIGIFIADKWVNSVVKCRKAQ